MISNSKKNRYYLLLLQGLIFSFLLLNYIFHDVSLSTVIKIYLYQFFAWFLTGRAIVRLLKMQVEKYSKIISLSYTFGAISSIIIYFVFMLSGLRAILPLFTVIQSGLTAFFLYKKQHIDEYETDDYGVGVCLAFLFIYLVLSLCAVSFVSSFPNETSCGTGYYIDWPYWAGNNIAFTKGFPADSFRQTGTEFKYHYFSSILMAQAALSTGVDINWISFYYSSILGGIILVLASYYCATSFVKNKWLVVVLMLTLLFTDGTTTALTWHSIICPFGFDYGYSYGMMSLAILAEIYRKNRFYALFFPSCLFIAMTTGCKGPVGAVVLVAYEITSLLYLIQGRIKQGIVSGLGWFISFLVIYMVFINSSAAFSEASGIQYIGGLGIDTVITNARWVAAIYNSVLAQYRIMGDHLLVKIYSVLLYIYRADKAVITLLLVALGLLLHDLVNKRFDGVLLSLLISSLTGILLAIYTTQSGGSQMYFMMGVFPAAAMSGGYALERISNWTQVKHNCFGLYKGLCIVLLLTIGISVNQYYETIIIKVREGISVVRNTYTAEDYGQYFADSTDYKAFEWIKNNTEENAVLAIDSHKDYYGRNNSMIMGVFSQRFIWNETEYVPDSEEAKRRNEIVTNVINNPDEYLSLMRAEGVDFFVHQVRNDGIEYLSQSTLLTEVYANAHYVIYKLLE